MVLRRFLAVIARWWWLLLLGPLTCGLTTYVASRTLPPVYRSTATLLVNPVSTGGGASSSDAPLNQQLVNTYSQLASQPVVLQAAQQRLGNALDVTALASMTEAHPLQDTQLFEISAQGSDPGLARDVANAVAEALVDRLNASLGGFTTPATSTSSALHIAQPALLPTSPIGPQVALNTLAAALAGLLAVAIIIGLFEYLDDTVKTPEELAAAVALPTLGAVARLRHGQVAQPQTGLDWSRGPEAEAYRLVRTNLEFSGLEQPFSSVLVASANPGEGKSTTLSHLALVLSQSGKRVIAVDADLRRPSLHRLFDIPNQGGLTNLLLSEMPRVSDYLQPSPIPSLWVLTSGPLPPNPSELLASPRMQALIGLLEAQADIVLFDSPALLAVTDALVLATQVSGTLLVVDSQRTRLAALTRAADLLQKSGTRLLGAVLNKVSRRSGSSLQYYNYYGSKHGRRPAGESGLAAAEARAHS
jgi:polysaccharide biosynthesis transport protein